MLYNVLLLLGTLFSLPKWLLKKKYRGTVLYKLGFNIPPKANKVTTIWLHMVSVGETKVMIPIYQKLRQNHPHSAIFISSTTKTGHAEAKRSLAGADGYFHLPIDFSWVMQRLVNRLKPDLLLLAESDFWPNMISAVNARGGKVVLINGKISERSRNRFAKFPRVSKRLFEKIDWYCIQNSEYANRFYSLYVPQDKITITGNLKLSIPPRTFSQEQLTRWKRKWNIDSSKIVITLGSTHEGEEEAILPHLRQYRVLLAPRHPERFAKVRRWLAANQYDNVTLIDQMGVLGACYRLSSLAIVGGSFLPGVGGHNIFEPIQAKIPVIFGPYMDTQKELVEFILRAQAGLQVPLGELNLAIPNGLALQENAQHLADRGSEPFEATWAVLKPYLLS